MIYFYLDESGTGLSDERSAFFVLAAFSVATDHWQKMDGALTTLKRRLVSWAKPEDWEIKGRDMRRGDKFFKEQPWEKRVQAIVEVADLLAHTPCRILAVQVDKRDLPDYISSDSDLYRIAFWRLLEMIEAELDEQGSAGMLMVDARSDLHSSVQDRRLLDAYREWTASRHGRTHLIELPWFGFSAFYAGLQLADFAAYVIDFVTNEHDRPKRSSELEEAYRRFQGKVKLAYIP